MFPVQLHLPEKMSGVWVLFAPNRVSSLFSAGFINVQAPEILMKTRLTCEGCALSYGVLGKERLCKGGSLLLKISTAFCWCFVSVRIFFSVSVLPVVK